MPLSSFLCNLWNFSEELYRFLVMLGIGIVQLCFTSAFRTQWFISVFIYHNSDSMVCWYICFSVNVRTFAVQEIQRLECEINASGGGTLTHRHWRQIWDRLDRASAIADYSRLLSPPSSTELSAVDMLTARVHVQNWHRRCTVELLFKSKILSEATKPFSQPHHFERFNYTTAAYCDYCTHVLWGLLKTGQFSCICCLSLLSNFSCFMCTCLSFPQ